jgi:DNA-3-methyladenine glycosylase
LRDPSPLRIDSPPPTPGSRTIAPLDRRMLPRDTMTLAKFLLGKIVVRQIGRRLLSGRIVETEAYLEADPACHAFRGMTPRNRSLYLEAGHAYVYLCYGTSYMLNVSSEAAGTGAGVLLRALEPLCGIDHMQRARGGSNLRDLARGPGRLADALGIDLRHDGLDLCRRGGLWIGDDGVSVGSIGESVRIGLSKGADARLRYFLMGSGYLSGSRSLNGTAPRARARMAAGPKL